MRARALCILALTLVGCDHVACPALFYIDAFKLVLEDQAWNPASYAIEVSYQDRFGSAQFLCQVSVPSVAWNGAIDGGLAALSDAGLGVPGRFACSPLQPTGRQAYGQAGKELVLAFEGTPTSAHLIVRDNGVLRLEQDVALSYQDYPSGPACDGPRRANARIQLPE